MLSSPVHDYFGTRKIFPVEILVPAAESLLRRVAEQGLEAEFIGNWWVQGNPYKGLNCVIVDHERHLRFEIQLHTEESARLADANHADYEIVRDRARPLEQRQAAFDRMVHQFADVIHPPGIDGIGTPVRTARPVPEPEQIDPREEIIAHVRDVAEKMGARVVVTAPEYPALLRYLLDEGREQMSLGKYRTALREFDRLIAEFARDLSLWSRRGVDHRVCKIFAHFDMVENMIPRYVVQLPQQHRTSSPRP